MNFTKITNEYYSKWLGVDSDLVSAGEGVFFIPSPERVKQQVGYSNIFDAYIFIKANLILVSYSEKLSNRIDQIKTKIECGMEPQEVKNVIEEVFRAHVRHHIKFVYNKKPEGIHESSNVVKLSSADYLQYHDFFYVQNPNPRVEGWLEEYFLDICRSELAFGIFQDNRLVCASDAPDMPYMASQAQEIGINTLSEYRGRGFGKSVSLECARSIVQSDRCPLWSCSSDNIASEKLAYSIGFQKLANVLTLSI